MRPLEARPRTPGRRGMSRIPRVSFRPPSESMSRTCPASPKPVTSVQACTMRHSSGESRLGRSFRVVIHRAASVLEASSSTMSAFTAVATIPVPTGFVRRRRSPGRAPVTFQSESCRTSPYTTRPYLGSLSSTLWPPRRKAPASATFSCPPRRTSFSTSSSRVFVGKPTMFNATKGFPPMAKTSLREFVAAICPQVRGSSDTGVMKSTVRIPARS